MDHETVLAYLDRVGVTAPAVGDAAGLRTLHRAHQLTVPFENLSIHLAEPISLDEPDLIDKIVRRRRGGWCYEMNGLFGAALAALGFRVTRLCGGVDRERLGDIAIGNHLTLRVDLDRPYLAEVGVGDAIIEPVPLAAGPISQRGFDFSIMPADGGWLRFNNHVRGIAKSFDFRPDHSDETAMVATHGWLMQDPASPFTNALAVLRHTADGYVALQNDCLRRVTANSLSEQRITSADHLADTLETVFDLNIPQPGHVWERLQAIGREKAA